MKHLIIITDGMADWKCRSLGNKTPLQYASTPYMDLLAKKGKIGKLHTVTPGFIPGSEVANLSILGYDVNDVYEGRAVLEATNLGIELDKDDLALRCNFITIENERFRCHTANHISTEEARILLDFLKERLETERVKFYFGQTYKHILVIKGGNKKIDCTPPHDKLSHPYKSFLVRPIEEGAQETVMILNKLIESSVRLLADHPINRKRKKEGLLPANAIWPWSPGYPKEMRPFSSTFPDVKKGAVISATDLINGIGKSIGFQSIAVEGATGLFDTNYENKAKATLEALETNDFVFLHIESIDEASHEGNLSLKLRTIEDVDKKIIKPIYHELVEKNREVAISVLPDHPTPCELKTHTADGVPFIVYSPTIEPDDVTLFDEESAENGAYGQLEKDEFIKMFMKL